MDGTKDRERLSRGLLIYREIEAYRGRRLVVYATSTRPGVQAMLAGDAVREFVEQIRAAGARRDRDRDASVRGARADRPAEPWTIGHAKRASDLSSEIGERMLRMHLRGEKNVGRIKEIAKNLNKSFLNHGDAVSRRRASELDLPIARPDAVLEELIWRAFVELEEVMELNAPFHTLMVFMAEPAAAATLAPMPALQLPPNSPLEVQQAAWNAVLQQALPAGTGPEVACRLLKVIVESTRRSAAIVGDGKISAFRLGLEIKWGLLETNCGWTVFPVPLPPTATPAASGHPPGTPQGPRRGDR